jgi:hypothetical protein
MPITASERAQISKIGALTKWSQCENRTAATAPARRALEEKIEREAREAHPELTDAELAKRVECARKLYYQRLALKSAQARRRRAGGNDHVT